MRLDASPLRCFHPSNALTYASLVASLSAIAFAARGLIGAAGALIAAAVILDTFDGRFARRFERSPTERDLGVQLDSLVDVVAFGVAPVICLGPQAFWPAAVFFVAAAVSRLAFYNVTHDEANGFVGLPVPVAALIWSTLLLIRPERSTVSAVLFVLGILMVLPIPIARPRGIAMAAFVCWPIAVIAAHAM